MRTKKKAYNTSRIADDAIEAANVQLVRVAGQDVAASTVGRLAHQILNLNAELRELDTSIEERFRGHRKAEVIESMPGFGHYSAPNFSPPQVAICSRLAPPTDWPASPA